MSQHTQLNVLCADLMEFGSQTEFLARSNPQGFSTDQAVYRPLISMHKQWVFPRSNYLKEHRTINNNNFLTLNN